ncbi:MAG: hypothetical protein IJW55_06140 [Clostridia bacterium]|nr:hypothetical protein [Clostridia bacterium]
MNPKLQAYIDAKKAELENEKNHFLMEEGLFDKVYVSDDDPNKDQYQSEWDEQAKKQKYYKKVPYAVTDEEFKEIKKLAQKTEKNKVAFALRVIGWAVYACGLLGGLGLLNDGFWSALICWSSALIGGTVLLGFSEVIRILNDIKNK